MNDYKTKGFTYEYIDEAGDMTPELRECIMNYEPVHPPGSKIYRSSWPAPWPTRLWRWLKRYWRGLCDLTQEGLLQLGNRRPR